MMRFVAVLIVVIFGFFVFKEVEADMQEKVVGEGEVEGEVAGDEKYQMNEYLMILSDKTAQQAIDQFPLILVKFYAPWCGHCKTLAPVYEQLAKTMALSEEAVQIAKIDCTIHSAVCQKHGIRGYPTLKYFVDGQAHAYAGKRTHDDIAEWLKTKPSEVRNQKEAEQF